MPHPPNEYLDNLDASSLTEPQPETITAFNMACARLDRISTTPNIFAADEGAICVLSAAFENGSWATGGAMPTTDHYVQVPHKETIARTIDLTTKDGTEYSFTERSSGDTRLLIRRPGERVRRESVPSQEIIRYTGSLSLAATGSPELMQMVESGIAEQEEARRLGIDLLTEGSLREFTNAIDEALDSGVRDKSP